MSKGVSRLLFNWFLIIFILFCYRNAMFWLTSEIYKIEINNLLLNIFLLLLELISIVTIIINRRLLRFKGIHLISLSWLLLISLVQLYNGSTLVVFLRCLLWPLLYEATYLFALRHKCSEEKLYKSYWVIVLIGLYVFFSSMQYTAFGGASNMIYFVLLSTPFLLMTENRKMMIFILLSISILAILSSKRSVILALFMFWIIQGVIYAIKYKKIIFTLVIGFFLSIIAIYTFSYIESKTGASMASRMENKDITNGREAIYMETWMLILQTSTDHYILGNGHNAVYRDTYRGISAHNEWLEILYDYGIIALFLYLCLWIYMVRKWFYLYRIESKFLMGYTLCLCIWVVMSMTSQLILYVSYVLYFFMYIAFVEAKTILYKLNNENPNYNQRISNSK